MQPLRASVRCGARKDCLRTIHRLPLLDGEREEVPVVPEEKRAILCDVFTQHLGCLLARDEPSIRIFAREDGLCCRIVVAEQPAPRRRLDAITPDDSIVARLGAILKHTHDSSRPVLDRLQVLELLAKLGDPVRYSLDQLVEEVRAIHATAGYVRVELDVVQGIADLLLGPDEAVRVGFALVAHADGEPAVHFAGALVRRAALVEGGGDGRGDVPHGTGGIGTEGDAGADLADCKVSRGGTGGEASAYSAMRLHRW
jgi:hypothetical protein